MTMTSASARAAASRISGTGSPVTMSMAGTIGGVTSGIRASRSVNAASTWSSTVPPRPAAAAAEYSSGSLTASTVRWP